MPPRPSGELLCARCKRRVDPKKPFYGHQANPRAQVVIYCMRKGCAPARVLKGAVPVGRSMTRQAIRLNPMPGGSRKRELKAKARQIRAGRSVRPPKEFWRRQMAAARKRHPKWGKGRLGRYVGGTWHKRIGRRGQAKITMALARAAKTNPSKWEPWNTGGGFMALRNVLPNGMYYLITHAELGMPKRGQPAKIGLYDQKGEPMKVVEITSYRTPSASVGAIYGYTPPVITRPTTPEAKWDDLGGGWMSPPRKVWRVREAWLKKYTGLSYTMRGNIRSLSSAQIKKEHPGLWEDIAEAFGRKGRSVRTNPRNTPQRRGKRVRLPPCPGASWIHMDGEICEDDPRSQDYDSPKKAGACPGASPVHEDGEICDCAEPRYFEEGFVAKANPRPYLRVRGWGERGGPAKRYYKLSEAVRAATRIAKGLVRAGADSPYGYVIQVTEMDLGGLAWQVTEEGRYFLIRGVEDDVEPSLLDIPVEGRVGAEANPRSGPADPTAVRELRLYIDNDADLYRQQTVPIHRNLMLKRKRGVYDSAKAATLFGYLVLNGAKKYIQEFGTPGPVDRMFNKNTRDAVSRELRDSFEAEAALGNYDDLVKKNPAGDLGFSTVDEAYEAMIDDRSHGDDWVAEAAQRLYPQYKGTKKVAAYVAQVETLARRMERRDEAVFARLQARKNPIAPAEGVANLVSNMLQGGVAYEQVLRKLMALGYTHDEAMESIDQAQDRDQIQEPIIGRFYPTDPINAHYRKLALVPIGPRRRVPRGRQLGTYISSAARQIRNPAVRDWTSKQYPTLTRSELIDVSREFKAKGWRLPPKGRCTVIGDGRELCHDARGYYWVGSARNPYRIQHVSGTRASEFPKPYRTRGAAERAFRRGLAPVWRPGFKVVRTKENPRHRRNIAPIVAAAAMSVAQKYGPGIARAAGKAAKKALKKVRKNPGLAGPSRKEIQLATKAAETFHDRPATKAKTVTVPDLRGKALTKLGKVTAIGYFSDKWNEREQTLKAGKRVLKGQRYIHEVSSSKSAAGNVWFLPSAKDPKVGQVVAVIPSRLTADGIEDKK